jgi:hypothetical protein
VVERARAEQPAYSQAVDRTADRGYNTATDRRGDRDQHDPGRAGDEERVRMSQPRSRGFPMSTGRLIQGRSGDEFGQNCLGDDDCVAFPRGWASTESAGVLVPAMALRTGCSRCL